VLVPLLALFSSTVDLKNNSIAFKREPRDLYRHPGPDRHAIGSKLGVSLRLIEFPRRVHENP
jgi:hypothetical protein